MPNRPQVKLPPNAGYLSQLEHRDCGPTHAGAEYAGPWEVSPVPGGFAVSSPGADDAPYAVLEGRDTAQLIAAILPVLGHDGPYRLCPAGPAGHYRLERWVGHDRGVEEAGRLHWYDQDLVELLNLVDYIARTPASLAYVMDAAGEPGLKRAGRLLCRFLAARPR